MEDLDFVRLVLSACAVVLNTYVFVALHLTREFKTAIGTLAKSLTFADIILGAASLFDFYRLWLNWSPNTKTCNVVSFILSTCLGATMAILAGISYERFYTLMYPTRHSGIFTNCKVYLFVFSCYIGCGVCFIPSLIGLELNPDYIPQSCMIYWEDYSAISFFVITILFIASVLIIASHSYHILTACMLGKLDMNDNLGSPLASSADKPADFDKKTTKAFLAAAVVFYATWLPFLIMSLKYHFVSELMSFSLYNSFLNLGLSSAITKCLIYLVWLPLFKKRLLGTCCCSRICNFVGCIARFCTRNRWRAVESTDSDRTTEHSLHYLNFVREC